MLQEEQERAHEHWEQDVLHYEYRSKHHAQILTEEVEYNWIKKVAQETHMCKMWGNESVNSALIKIKLREGEVI